MKKKIDRGSAVIQNISVEQGESVHAIFRSCVAWLNELRTVRDLYKTYTPDDWKLHDERALYLNSPPYSFIEIGEFISRLAYALPSWLDEEWAGQEQPDVWAEWTTSAFDIANELMRGLKTAKELAEINLSTSRLYQHLDSLARAPTTDRTNGHNNGNIRSNSPNDGGVWVQLREDLATEGILDEAIEGIEDRLKDCIRNLVQGKTPHWEPPAIEHNTAKRSTVPDVSPHDGFESNYTNTNDRLDEAVVQKVTAAFDILLPENYHKVAPEIMEIAMQSELEQSAKTFRQVLRIMYDTACRDPGQAAIYARFARDLQKNLTPKLQKCICPSQSFWNAQAGYDPGPVTIYLENRCWEDWNHGKKGRRQVSPENFALGLSCFIGELVKHKVLGIPYASILTRRLLGPDPPVGITQFVALYQLLRIAGSTMEPEDSISEDMSLCFQRINTLMYAPGAPKRLKALGMELKEMRRSGWKALKRQEESKALGQAIAKIRAEASQTTRYVAVSPPETRTPRMRQLTGNSVRLFSYRVL